MLVKRTVRSNEYVTNKLRYQWLIGSEGKFFQLAVPSVLGDPVKDLLILGKLASISLTAFSVPPSADCRVIIELPAPQKTLFDPIVIWPDFRKMDF